MVFLLRPQMGKILGPSSNASGDKKYRKSCEDKKNVPLTSCYLKECLHLS